jgi:hypothetical protein
VSRCHAARRVPEEKPVVFHHSSQLKLGFRNPFQPVPELAAETLEESG